MSLRNNVTPIKSINQSNIKPLSFVNHCNKIAIASLAVVCFFVAGCTTGHLYLLEQPNPGVLEPIKTSFADAPVNIQVLDFAVTSVKSDANNESAAEIKKNFALLVPNVLYKSLGYRHVFSKVWRAPQADGSADYVVSGDYSLVFRIKKSVAAYFIYPAPVSVYVKGTTHVKVVEAKTGTIVFEKTYIEEHTDKALNSESISSQLLHPAQIETISFDIKKAIYSKMGKDL